MMNIFCRVVHLLLVFVLAVNAWTTPPWYPPDSQIKCEIITVPMCRTNTSKYDKTRLPNFLGFTSQRQVQNFTENKQMQKLVQTKCSKDIVFFLCSVMVPICIPESIMKDVMVPPCRSLCQNVYSDCIQSIKRLNATWPGNLNCSGLPDHNEGMCITPNAFVTPKFTASCSKSKTKITRETSKKKKRMNFTKYDYVFRMRYEGRRKRNGANKVYVAKVLSQFGCGSSQLPFVDELFLDKMCRKKFRRNSGDVWIFAKKGSNSTDISVERGIYNAKNVEMRRALRSKNCVSVRRNNNSG